MSNQNGNNGTNGNGKRPASYAAAAGISTTADEDETVVAAAPAAASAAAAANQTDPSEAGTLNGAKVGDALNVKAAGGGKASAARGVVVKLVALVCVLALVCVGGYFMFFVGGSGARTVRTRVADTSRTGKDTVQSDEQLTADAIARVRSQVAPAPTPGATVAPNTPAIIVQPAQQQPVVSNSVGPGTLDANAAANQNTPVVRPADGVSGTVNTNANTNANTSAQQAPRAGGGSGSGARVGDARTASKANPQKAIIFGEVAPAGGGSSPAGDGADAAGRDVDGGFALRKAGNAPRGASDVQPAALARPPFGSLLPVRTLGAVYTLRTGALVRMELTRDVGGAGWKLPRRTVIVGTLRGGEYDRAYVSVVGYIDSSSGRLVTFGGSLLGSDAGEGMKGERRQLSNRWARIFGPLADRGLNILQARLGRTAGTTVVLSDSGSPEINALTGNRDRREFVAVRAGSTGFISVTDLPRGVEGVDALSQMEPDALAQLLNSGANTGTGLTDEQVAQLISSGSDEQIRGALPYMNENMRRLAEQVLRQSER